MMRLTITCAAVAPFVSVAALAIAACSSEADESTIGGGENLATATNGEPEDHREEGLFNGSGNGGLPPATEFDPDQDECAGEAFAAEALPVDMYIMLDKSSSMLEPLDPTDPTDTLDRWTATVAAVKSFARHPRAANVRVGLQYFGLPDACNVNDYATPEVPIDALSNNANAIVSSIESHFPTTLTPMGPAVEGGLRYMKSWAAENPQRAPVFVLATDGYPTECEPRLTGIERMVKDAVEEDPRVMTFVIGIGGVPNLDRIAVAGGSGSAYLIDSGDLEEQFVSAMLSIASTPLSCEFDVPEPVDEEMTVDLDMISVVYTRSATGARESVPKVNGLGDCILNQNNGWYYDHPTSPEKIMICPGTCANFAAGSVEIRLGCRPPRGVTR